jgi:hypothetical protein
MRRPVVVVLLLSVAITAAVLPVLAVRELHLRLLGPRLLVLVAVVAVLEIAVVEVPVALVVVVTVLTVTLLTPVMVLLTRAVVVVVVALPITLDRAVEVRELLFSPRRLALTCCLTLATVLVSPKVAKSWYIP